MPPRGPDLALRAEAACFAAWPALREEEMDGWLLRFAGGHTTRANSVNVAGPSFLPPAGKITACEASYRAEGLPTVFRLTTAVPAPGLEAALDAAGYGPPRDVSLVLHADLAGCPTGGAEGVTLAEGVPDARWLAASATLAGLNARSAGLRSRMFGALSAPAAFATVHVEGAVAAQALGAAHRGLVCLNSIATASDHRGRGLAGRAVAAILGWAVERHGARGACLQIQADNRPALALYRRLGFGEELSRYAYRDRRPL